MYVYLYTFHKMTICSKSQLFCYNTFFSFEDELSLYATKLFRNNNKSFMRIYTQKCNLRYAHRSPDIRFGSDLV